MDLTTVEPGVTLQNVLADATLSIAQALRHTLHIALALRAMHEKGEVCGVLDPSRILLSADEAVLGQAAPEVSPYTAPELLAGTRPDVRSDIFAFGALAYQLVTGRPPFTGVSPAEIAQAVREQAPAPLEFLRDGEQQVPAARFPGLERILSQCLEKNPDQRWQRVRSICIELKLLNTEAGRLHPSNHQRRSLDEQIREQISRLESAVGIRIAACEQSLQGLQSVLTETREHLQATAHSLEEKFRAQTQSFETLHNTVGRTDDLLERVVESIAACDHTVAGIQRASFDTREQLDRTVRDIEERVAGTREQLDNSVRGIEERFAENGDSISTLRASVSRTDDLLERVVESIDSLQSFVLERTAEAGCV